MSSNEVSASDTPETPRSRRQHQEILRCCLWLVAVLGLLCASCVFSYGLGVYVGALGSSYQQAIWYEERITRFLKEHESRFGQLEVSHSSEGYALLYGNVATQSDLDHLRAEMTRLFGEEMAAKVVEDVEVDNEKEKGAGFASGVSSVDGKGERHAGKIP